MVIHEISQSGETLCYFDSSNILCCKYNPNSRNLAIIFEKGHQYIYQGVLPYHFQRFKLSKSTAKGLSEFIIKNYGGIKTSYLLSIDEKTDIINFINESKPK